MKKLCPNSECKSLNFIKDGKFKRKSDCQIIQRFRCKECGDRFSNASFSLAKNQNKRVINRMVFSLFCSGVSMRRIAKTLSVDKKTIDRKLEYLNLKAKLMNLKTLERLKDKVTYIQLDDLITSEHTKLKPITVTIAVDVHTRLILSIKTGHIPAFGHLAKLSRQKYGTRKSEHKKALAELFQEISPFTKSCIRVDSDEHKFYPEFTQAYLKNAEHVRYKGGRGCVVGQGELKKLQRDPLFAINHTCAMLRDNLKRLARKTWCTTKRVEQLQKHLNIYIWYHNYEILSG